MPGTFYLSKIITALARQSASGGSSANAACHRLRARESVKSNAFCFRDWKEVKVRPPRLLRGRHGDHAEIGDPVPRGVPALAMVGRERLHFAHEVGLSALIITFTGADNL